MNIYKNTEKLIALTVYTEVEIHSVLGDFIEDHREELLFFYDMFEFDKGQSKQMAISNIMKKYDVGLIDSENFVNIMTSNKSSKDFEGSEIEKLRGFIKRMGNRQIFFQDIKKNLDNLNSKTYANKIQKLLFFVNQSINNEIDKLNYIYNMKTEFK